MEAGDRVEGGSIGALPMFASPKGKRRDCGPIVEIWSPPVIKNIQALRGAAAILVMVMHAFSTAKEFYAFHAERDPFVDAAQRISSSIGLAGVDIFFVISGFIVLTVAMKSAQGEVSCFSPGAAGLFYFRRLTRIYPLYWIVLVAAVTSASFVQPDRWQAIARHPSVIFLMARNYDDVPTAWSLTFELYFYSIVAVGMLVASRRLLVFIAAWALLQTAVLVTTATCDWQFGIGSGIFANPLILEFLFGCAIAVAIQRGVSRFAMPAILLGILILFIGAYLKSQIDDVQPSERVAVFGVAGGLLVYGLVANERNKRFVLRGLGWAGDASYSIYLWHLPVYWTVNWTGTRLGIYLSIPRILTPFIWMTFGLGIGVLSYWLIERPMLAAVRTRLQSRTRVSVHCKDPHSESRRGAELVGVAKRPASAIGGRHDS
jgi:exopolysaccharide production protein ExoZ